MSRWVNPQYVDKRAIKQLYDLALREGTTKSLGPPEYTLLTDLAKSLIPRGWKVIWLPPDADYSYKAPHTIQDYKTIVIPYIEDKEQLVELIFHEVYHSRSFELGGHEHLYDNRFWDELDADIYAMKSLLQNKNLYKYSLDEIIINFIYRSFIYGVTEYARIAREEKRSPHEIDIPKRWEFLIPYIYQAMIKGSAEFEKSIGTPGFPRLVIANYKKLLSS